VSAAEPAEIEYAVLAARFGVTCEHLPDGGVRIVFPPRVRCGSAVAGVLSAFIQPIEYLFNRLRRREPEPMAVIELTSEHLLLRLRDPEYADSPPETRTSPRGAVGELRANRYSRGLLVRIPGKDNFDILGEWDPALVRHVGELLTEALERTAAGTGELAR
jgi:hypothetical protein